MKKYILIWCVHLVCNNELVWLISIVICILALLIMAFNNLYLKNVCFKFVEWMLNVYWY